MTNTHPHHDSPHPDRTSERFAAIEIIRTLRAHNHIAYLAGGCVRDLLLGHDPKDYDVATDATPDQIATYFTKTAAVGASFGVMLVRDHGPSIEVATFRADGPYSDARRPDHVTFSTPELDAQRRDFTINALFLDPDLDNPRVQPTIIDLVEGKADLQTKTLRAVGNPDHRLQEDHLRALRAIRFASKYTLTIDPTTSKAIIAHASNLTGVSVERIGQEIRRMMAHPSRAIAAALIESHTLDNAIFSTKRTTTHPPKANQSQTAFPTLNALHDRADTPTALAAWALDRYSRTILDKSQSTKLNWDKDLDLSNTLHTEFISTLEIVGIFFRSWTSMSIAGHKRLAARPRASHAIDLTRAIDPTLASTISTRINELQNDGIGIAPPPLITGEDLISLGATPSKMFKIILDSVYDEQLNGSITTHQDACNHARVLLVKYKKFEQ